jgi:hypothetical protein
VTILSDILAKGYFPKELPPAFFSEQFSRYACTRHGRSVIQAYKPSSGSTECVNYQLALPGLRRRSLRVPHPATFAHLSGLCAKHFARLLRKSARSTISRSRPVYQSNRSRALHPLVKHSNLARERAAIRGGSSFLLKLDVSDFYPSLYTHAIGWAIDPKLRQRLHWHNRSLLGKRLDQCLMDLQGKSSQGIPIGPDVCFLLAEIVLAQVDRACKLKPDRAFRWFDDYEVACDSHEEAERLLSHIVEELHKFRLRINPAKTRIVPLPVPVVNDEWQRAMPDGAKRPLGTASEMVHYFDIAFSYRQRFPESAVMLYALGALFRLRVPRPGTERVAQSGVTQALMAEPGCAQKAFALLTFWVSNGLRMDRSLLARTVSRMVIVHGARGMSSDVAWALSFCATHRLELDNAAARVLARVEDDCIGIQALQLHREGLLASGFSTSKLSKLLRGCDLDGEHWLIAYEAVRHGFLFDSEKAVLGNPLFCDLLQKGVTFYRNALPNYAIVIHPGGAPEWAVQAWFQDMLALPGRPKPKQPWPSIVKIIRRDLIRLGLKGVTPDDAVADLLDIMETDEFAALLEHEETYFSGHSTVFPPTVFPPDDSTVF